MKIQKIELISFKRFHNLTIDLGDTPRKIIALVGPNGCGKSSIFDAFESCASRYRGQKGIASETYCSKSLYSQDIAQKYDANNAVKITTIPNNYQLSKKSFIIRSSYRFTSRLNIQELKQKPDILEDNERPGTSIDIDRRLSDNYERLYAKLIQAFHDGNITGDQVREELIGKMNSILEKILDIRISSLGNVMNSNEGQLFFEKGSSKRFPYENLSSGEKEVIDIIIDFIIKDKVFDDTIYCIDEPELHISTAIQKKLLIEISKLIPENCQLWIATHSIGFLRALQDDLKDETQVIDFSGSDFDTDVTLKPIKQTRQNWKNIFTTALEDLTGLIAPKTIIYCEGRIPPGPANAEAGLDAICYNNIFEEEFHDSLFVSSGGSTAQDKHTEFSIMILTKALSEITILLLKDKDINSDGSETTEEQRLNWLQNSTYHRMLKRKEIENYLFDFSVICKVYPNVTQPQYDAVIPNCELHDVKSKSGALKDLCGENRMNVYDFKIKLSKNIDSSMRVYDELKQCIFDSNI